MTIQPTDRIPLRILLADDSSIARALLRESVRDVLKTAGRTRFEIVEVGTGEQALDKIEREQFDLLLLDYLLPVMNGEAVLRKLRASPQTADLPVIVISCGPDDLESKALAVGATSFLAKPVVTSRLTKALREALQVH